MPVIVLAGEEDFELYRRVDELKKELVDPAWVHFNFAQLSNPDLLEVTEAAHTLPFGPGKRVVLCDRTELFTKKKSSPKTSPKASSESERSEKAQKELLEQLDQALSSMADETYLIFACPFNFDSTLRTSKVVGKYARLEEFLREKYWVGSHNVRLESWCHKEAKRHGATMDDAAIMYLLDSTEANLRQISSEIAKAAVYLLPENHITLDTVSLLSPHHSHVFALLEDWAHGRRNPALTDLEELLSKQSGIPIIATLHTTLSKWIQLKALVAQEESHMRGKHREIPLPDLSRRLSSVINAKPFAIEMDLKRIKSLSLRTLIEKRKQLVELEMAVKTGQMPDRHALTLFLVS